MHYIKQQKYTLIGVAIILALCVANLIIFIVR